MGKDKKKKKKKNKYYEKCYDENYLNVFSEEEVELAAEAMEMYLSRYIYFIIPQDMSEKEFNECVKELKKMIELMKDPRNIHKVFDLDYVKIIKEEFSSDEGSGLLFR